MKAFYLCFALPCVLANDNKFVAHYPTDTEAVQCGHGGKYAWMTRKGTVNKVLQPLSPSAAS
jgi:hypothetical protein